AAQYDRADLPRRIPLLEPITPAESSRLTRLLSPRFPQLLQSHILPRISLPLPGLGGCGSRSRSGDGLWFRIRWCRPFATAHHGPAQSDREGPCDRAVGGTSSFGHESWSLRMKGIQLGVRLRPRGES